MSSSNDHSRADICDPAEPGAVNAFRKILHDLATNVEEEGWSAGVTLYRAIIDGEKLLVFSDAHSIDIEGPEHLVKKVMDRFHLEKKRSK